MNMFLSEPKTCATLSCPMDEGQSASGVKLAPNVLKLMGLKEVIESLGYTYVDAGTIDTTVDKQLAGKHKTADEDLANVPTNVTTNDEEEEVINSRTESFAHCGRVNKDIHESVYAQARKKNFLINVGGDHGIACGTIAGMLRVYPDLAVIWVDAHSDCNTLTSSPSKNYHGMPVAHLLGWMQNNIRGFEWMHKVPTLPESQLCYVGLRSVDDGEKKLINNSKVNAFTIRDVDKYGIDKLMDKVLELIDPLGNRPIHMSLDIDACDPSIAPGTGTPIEGGLTYREIHYICEKVFKTGRFVSMDLVEINPLMDSTCVSQYGDRNEIKSEATLTVKLGINLIAAALGDSIL